MFASLGTEAVDIPGTSWNWEMCHSYETSGAVQGCKIHCVALLCLGL